MVVCISATVLLCLPGINAVFSLIIRKAKLHAPNLHLCLPKTNVRQPSKFLRWGNCLVGWLLGYG